MIKEALQYITGLSAPNTKEIDGRLFSDKPMSEVKSPFIGTDDFPIHTLSGIVDYLKIRDDNAEHYIIHVADYNKVFVYGEYEAPYGKRKLYITSFHTGFKYQFGKFYDPEMFIINLQSEFQLTDMMKGVLTIAGGVRSESAVETSDDGFTQNVTAKTGIAKLVNIELPNPILLAPYRSFPEIEPVEIPCILRCRKTGAGVEFALFESGGTQCVLEYIKRIRDHLAAELKSIKGLNFHIIA
mgnify:CR=1 FL=1